MRREDVSAFQRNRLRRKNRSGLGLGLTLRLSGPVCLALLSGIMLAYAFPPLDAKWLVWVGLVPLVIAVQRASSPRRAFLLGWLAGTLFFCNVLYPLVSAHLWVGWVREGHTELFARYTRQWWFLHALWVIWSLFVGGVFWGAWAAILKRWALGRWSWLVFGTAAWVLIPEWVRARAIFGFEWGFLGYACADWTAVRQLAAVGGVPLLSGLVVLVNFGIASVFVTNRQERGWWGPAGIALSCLGLATIWGAWAARSVDAPKPNVPVALVQYSGTSTNGASYNEIGFIQGYASHIIDAINHGVRLIVLPETVMWGVVTLDGTPSNNRPPYRTYPLASWTAMILPWLRATDTALIVGINAVVEGRDHNTLFAWTAAGPVGAYHKQRLVPFSEYRPWGWGGWTIRGSSLLVPGHGSQLLRLPRLTVGEMICQEVLFSSLTRASVRDGATLLVSGGNDGVFANPAVACFHADAAQLRAVEAGRYLVRAMKTGISAIIDPVGRELAQSRLNEDAVLYGTIAPRTILTPYVRFGDWVVWLSAFLVLVVVGFQRRRR